MKPGGNCCYPLLKPPEEDKDDKQEATSSPMLLKRFTFAAAGSVLSAVDNISL